MQHISQVMAAFIAAIEIEAERRRRIPRNIPDRSNPLEVLSERQVIDRYRIGLSIITIIIGNNYYYYYYYYYVSQ